jgi:hypothetical protein
LFKRFEPKVYGKEEYHIFNAFTAYREEEVEMLLTRIKKVHGREKLENEDYQLLKVTERLPKALNSPKENLFMLTSPQGESDKRTVERPSLRNKLSSHTLTHNKSSSILLSDKTNTLKLPRCPSGSLAPDAYTSPTPAPARKLRFNNIIIIVPLSPLRRVAR